MSDIDSSAIGNGAPQGGNGPANPEDLPQFRVMTQYIKDFSFENPGAPESLRGSQEQPQTDVGIDVQAKRNSEEEFEATIRLNITSRRGEEVGFILELVYSGLFHIKNVPQESLQPVLLIECPRILFPFLRRVVSDITRDGGFAPLMLDPIDFAALYRNQMEQAAQQAQAGQGGDVPAGQPN